MILSYRFYISAAIFAGTLLLVIRRPRNFGIGYSALIGAAASYALGMINFSSVIAVWDIVWNATFTFIAIILISLVLDEAGVFRYAALRIARMAGGHGNLLFLFIIILGSGISAIFANDGTALILTPIVYEMLVNMNVERRYILPFIMATGFIADSASLPLVVSNLVNIVSATYFHITFLEYAHVMILPDLVSVAASLGILYLYYRKAVISRYVTGNLGNPREAILSPIIAKISIPVIVVLIILYSVGGIYDVPIAFISVGVAAFVMVVARYGRDINTTRIIREAPWQIVIFSFGMYLVVYGLGLNGLTDLMVLLLAHIVSMPGPLPYVFSGYFFAFLASGMNNMPSVMLGALSISSIHNANYLIYTNVIGNDIGPKFTPIGSLATLLWLHTLDRKNGIKIGYGYYMKVGFTIALPVLTFTLLSLYLL
jgi:arsenical pump membrane protein